MSEYRIEPGKVFDGGRCACCGEQTRALSGFVYKGDVPRGVYYMRWTTGRPDDGAVLAVSIGEWAGDAPPSKRECVGLDCRILEDGPAFRVIDAKETPWGNEAFLGKKLTRKQALASPVSQEAFAIVDRIVADDDRTEPWFRVA